MVGFFVFKILDDYDYSFVVGVLCKMIDEFVILCFIEWGENVVLFGLLGVGKMYFVIVIGYVVM